VLDDPVYLAAAGRAADFILTRATPASRRPGLLLHRFRDGEAAIPAFLDDYAFFVWGLIELYEAGFDPARLRQAQELVDHTLKDFRDPQTGGFQSSAAYHEQLLVRRQEVYDGAVPSGSSVMLSNLLRLSRLLGAPAYEAHAGRLVAAGAAEVAQAPAAHTQFLSGLDLALSPGQEVLIAGGAPEERAALLAALRPAFLPHAAVLVLSPATRPALLDLAPWVADYPADRQPAAAYVCTGRACQAPVTSAAELAQLLR